MLQSAREWRSTPAEAQKFGLQQHPGKQSKIDLSTLNCLEANVGEYTRKKQIQKQKKNSYWRLDDENEDDNDYDDEDDDDTV